MRQSPAAFGTGTTGTAETAGTRASARPRWLPATPLLVTSIVYVACLAWSPRILQRLDPLTGDEPFYVMTAISLIEDGDLNERNNYDERDFDRFYPQPGESFDGWPGYPDPLPPHASQTERPGLYSKHGLGMALLVAIPFALGGRPLILVVLAVLAALVAANAVLLAARYTGSSLLAGAIGLALALTNPLASFSLLIFPEMSAALCVVYATRRILAERNSAWQWLGVGACAAALPWLHYRLAPISVVLALLALVRHREVLGWREALAALALPVPSAVALAAWYSYLYGGPLPPAADHAGFSRPLGTLNGLAGTFLDQQWGALIHNPLLALAIATAVPFAVYRRGDATTLAAIVLPYLLLISAYQVWWGEWNPPARYLTAIVPLAAAPLAWWLARLPDRRWAWAALGVFALPALVVTATFVADPQRMYNHPDGTSRLFETWSESTALRLMEGVPSFVFYSLSPVGLRQATVLAAILIVGLLAAVALLLVRPGRGDDVTPEASGLPSGQRRVA